MKRILWGIVPCLLWVGVASAQQNYNAVAGGDLLLDFVSSAAPGPAKVEIVSTSPSTPFVPWYVTETNPPNLTIPAATAPGTYTVTVGSTSFTVTVRQPDQLPSSPYPVVVLVDGFSVAAARGGAQTIQPVEQYWGQLGAILGTDRHTVIRFQNSHECPEQSIEACAWAFKGFLEAQTGPGAAQIQQFDIITHSMGGLIARAYLAGDYPQGWFPPVNPRIRKAIVLGSPNFGAENSITTNNVQSNEMLAGSEFLWQLAIWNQGADDMRGIDVVGVVGNGAPRKDGTSDGVVPLVSASMGFMSAQAPERTRVVDYCHMQKICGDTPGLNYVDSASHATARVALSFLDGTNDWLNVGTSRDKDPILSQKGALMAKLFDKDGLPEVNAATYTDLVNEGPITFNFTTNSGQTVPSGSTVQPGYVQTYSLKTAGPIIGRIFNPDRLGLFTLMSGRTVTIYGTNLLNSDGTAPQEVWANEHHNIQVLQVVPAAQSQYGDQVIVSIPDDFDGSTPIWWKIINDKGSHIVRTLVRKAN